MRVVRWGLIGAGDIARKRIAPAMLDLTNCELISVARSKAELAEEFANTKTLLAAIVPVRDMVVPTVELPLKYI